MNKNLVRYKAITGFILFLVAVLMALMIYRIANASTYPTAPSDAGTLILNGGDCNRRTATWTHGGDYELYSLPITAPVCSSLGGTPFEHPYSLYSKVWDGTNWIEIYDNRIEYPVSHCHEMPGGTGWGGQQMMIRPVGSIMPPIGMPVDNAAPGWRCERRWLPEVRK